MPLSHINSYWRSEHFSNWPIPLQHKGLETQHKKKLLCLHGLNTTLYSSKFKHIRKNSEKTKYLNKQLCLYTKLMYDSL
jgi:hypothetical protein